MLWRIAAAVAAILLVGRAAMADDIPGDSSTKAVLQVTNVGTAGVLDTPTDSDWYRVQLTKSQDFAVRFTIGHGAASLSLYSVKRKPLRTTWTSDESDGGFEVRAPYTGTYFVEVKVKEDVPPGTLYQVAVVHDCKNGLDTRCTLVPGKTFHVGSAWYNDVDLYAARLDRSKQYTFAGTPTGPDPEICAVYMDLLDRTGKTIIL